MKKYNKGIVFSTFDLLHAGHVLMLKDAKSICNTLIAGLHLDPSIERMDKNKPIQSILERKIQLEAIKYVDIIIPYMTEENLIEILKSEKPDVRILGSDYKNKSYTGNDLNIPVYYHDRNHNYSSSKLRDIIYKEEKKLRE